VYMPLKFRVSQYAWRCSNVVGLGDRDWNSQVDTEVAGEVVGAESTDR
jgi:hypothetical protein